MDPTAWLIDAQLTFWRWLTGFAWTACGVLVLALIWSERSDKD
jgi:hypothetical protein